MLVAELPRVLKPVGIEKEERPIASVVHLGNRDRSSERKAEFVLPVRWASVN
mgnify:CR=1 FL=1